MKAAILAVALVLVTGWQAAFADDMSRSDARYIEDTFLGVWAVYDNAGMIRVDLEDGRPTIMLDDADVQQLEFLAVDKRRGNVSFSAVDVTGAPMVVTLRIDEDGDLWLILDSVSLPARYVRSVTAADRKFLYANRVDLEPRGPEERGCGLFNQFCE